ncbi:MAG: outer membrane protein assembly factor BamE [Alphaproteobacteria bacterium]|nr:outer membrane protein assembly factor BamE [Alphaproteobacteria bacterium]
MSTNKILFSMLTAAMLCSCSSDVFVSHNGNMPTNDRISQLKTGQSKEEVLSLLGAPSSVVSLDKNTWIYMSSEVKQVAFFKPTEISRDVLTVKFDKYDQVADIDRLDKKEGTEVAVSSDATLTPGQEPGFFEKYFGGVGQYMPFSTKNRNNM